MRLTAKSFHTSVGPGLVAKFRLGRPNNLECVKGCVHHPYSLGFCVLIV